MKKFTIIFCFILLSIGVYSQTYKSAYVITQKATAESEMKDRIITISDKEISISNFRDGYKKPLILIVNKIEEKDYYWEGVCKYYYCTTKEKDFMFGYEKAIIIKKSDKLYLGLFSTEIDVNHYQFNISD